LLETSCARRRPLKRLYIGLDVHARTFAMVVLSGRGRILLESQWGTSCESLRATLTVRRKPRRTMIWAASTSRK
jgi:hypothetical protein